MMIPYGRQLITPEDIDKVVEVLNSDFLTQGPMVPEFERRVCDLIDVEYSIAVNSATSALHIACLSLGVGPGTSIWTSPNSFVASSNCALYCGARVDFVDIDSRSLNMSTRALSEKLRTAKLNNTLPKVVIPVHFAGQSCAMEEIFALSKQYGFRIIEDASHAIGGKYKNENIGNCRFSDITIFSFHPVKIITTGEGGMALTKNANLARFMRLLRSHGITRDNSEFKNPTNAAWYYEQQILGFNYRLTDIQAALGVSQLKRIDENIYARHSIAKYYDENLRSLPLVLPWQDPNAYSAFHLYPVQINSKKTCLTREKVFNFLRENGVGVNIHYIPIHTQPFYKEIGFKVGDFPVAENYYSGALSLPIYPGLKRFDQDYVIGLLQSIFTQDA